MSPSRKQSKTAPTTAPTVPLQVYAGDRSAEIFVIDAKYAIVERSVESLATSLAPGIYKVKVRTGQATEERLIVLNPQAPPPPLRFEPSAFASPAPLAQTAKTHEYDVDAAVNLSRQPPLNANRGEGSSLFFFIRHWSPAAKDPGSTPAPDDPARGLSLWDAEGERVVDFANPNYQQSNWNEGVSSRNEDPWVGVHIAVAPGPYVLRLDMPGMRLQQTIVASPGWQTQVFLTQRRYAADDDNQYADLPGASIFMARLGAGFSPESDGKRLTELARQGLRNGRQVLSQETSRSILDGKFEDPMLGLYGAHLMLAQKAITIKNLRIVVNNMRRLLGKHSHPDVEALALRVDPRLKSYQYPVPPMMSRSWAIVAAASVKNSGLVPEGSLADQCAAHVWKEEPWLLWQMTYAAGKDTLELVLDAPMALGLADNGADDDDDRYEYHRAIWQTLRSFGPESRNWTAANMDDAKIMRLVKSLGLPRSSLMPLLDSFDFTSLAQSSFPDPRVTRTSEAVPVGVGDDDESGDGE